MSGKVVVGSVTLPILDATAAMILRQHVADGTREDEKASKFEVSTTIGLGGMDLVVGVEGKQYLINLEPCVEAILDAHDEVTA